MNSETTAHPEYRHLRYRPDVDGLRALAVIAVVGFHAFPRFVAGGFVGVDVFFVISGYLICGIIFGSLKSGGFSYREFYTRRILRIFPALLTVLATVLVIGWVSLLADEFAELGRETIGGAGFIANFVFWREAGYFDVSASLKPLLHLWSLGVEEQFYIVWPGVLYLAWRLRLNLLAVTAGVLIASFGGSIATLTQDSAAAFYSPLTRFWEIQLGAVLAYLAPSASARGGNVKAWLGLALIVAAIFAFDDNDAFPGWRALLPTIGSALMIAAGPSAWFNRWILSSPRMVGLGLISYPLYLWHWPLLSFATIINGRTPSPLLAALILICSGALAWVTYRFVETPIRHGSHRATNVGALCGAIAGIGALAGLVVTHAGFVSRPIAMAYREIGAAASDWEADGSEFQDGKFKTSDLIGRTSDTVLFVGDSKMQQYWPRLKYIYDNISPKRSSIFATVSNCPSLPDTHLRGGERGQVECDHAFVMALKLAQKPNVRVIVFGSAWEYHADRKPLSLPGKMDEALSRFGEIIRGLREADKEVYVILANAKGAEFDPRRMADSRWLFIAHGITPPANAGIDRVKEYAKYRDVLNRVAAVARSNGATVIDPFDYFCDAMICPTVIEGHPVNMDFGHLSASFVRERATFIDDIVGH